MALPPCDPIRVWQWVANLNFHGSEGPEESNSVRELQENHGLRQGIIAHVFGDLIDRDRIFEAKRHFQFLDGFHSGLCLRPEDYRFIVDLAFDTDNPVLWSGFMAQHKYHREIADRGPDALRRHMREQALAKPPFMRAWAKTNQAAARFERENIGRHSRKMKRRHRMEDAKRAAMSEANIKYVREHREQVEGDRHWNCLVRFADLVLFGLPEEIELEFGDERLVGNALKNCLDFIDDEVPDLQRLAQLQCASEFLRSESILYAACLAILRDHGNLECVDRRLLQALRTNIDTMYSNVDYLEKSRLRSEVERLSFPDDASAEEFLRQYVEPQLTMQGCVNPEIGQLKREGAFKPCRSKISIEWLRRFPDLNLSSLDTLFGIAAQFGDREELKEIIAERCAEFIFFWPDPTENENIEQKRRFWFLRAFFFQNDAPDIHWEWLKSDKDTVPMLGKRTALQNRSDHSAWPKLTSEKVEAILDAFVDQWPRVHLPRMSGTGSPKEETAYRFLTEVVWSISADDPDRAIPVLDRLVADARFADFHMNLKNIRAGQVRRKALRDFEPPTPGEIMDVLDHDAVVTVEGLRQLVIQELQDFQKDIDGGEFNSADLFYEKGERLGEVRSTEIIAERLRLRLEPQDITVAQEHRLKAAKRADFTVTRMIGGKRKLLVTEVKGQWHDDLYTAASAQLYERYSIHPDAGQQGIFLVIWFGADEEVAGRKNHEIGDGQALRKSIEAKLPSELAGRIDVFVLDVSKPK